AVSEAHESRAARRIGDGALWSAGHAADPFLARFREHFARLAGAGADLAVLAAGNQPRFRLVKGGGEQAVMHRKHLVAMVEAVDRAVGEREMRHAAEEDGSDAMAIEIER